MATKKFEPTLLALRAQIAALQAQADALRKKEVAEVVTKVKAAMDRYGLTAADLELAPITPRKANAPAAKGTKLPSKAPKKGGTTPSSRAVKFKDDQGNTWGGIGKRPDWFKAALAAGKTPEDLLANR